ncbi:MAG: hypothetical protein KKA73_01650 [Chloroflexi bacterium]|nr:hypothetical protein [Chloroflexota bacterium]MBU1746369.1 hypothetical protein [Chloroflexota bacterium]
MAQRFRIPKKVTFARQAYRGVTLRQLIYLVVGAALGGLFLLNDVGGLDFIVRIVICLVIFALFAALAYTPVQGGHLDSWLPHLLEFIVRPRLRVWRKTGVDDAALAEPIAMDMMAPEPPPLAPALPEVPLTAAQASILERPIQDLLPYGVWIEILVVVTLILVTLFLFQGGYQVLEWFLR